MLCVCVAASAQENHLDSTDVFYKHLELNEIVVTGLAGDSKLKEMPTPVSVIRPVDLTARAGGNIINAIAAEPGLNEISTGGGISKPVIRGMGQKSENLGEEPLLCRRWNGDGYARIPAAGSIGRNGCRHQR